MFVPGLSLHRMLLLNIWGGIVESNKCGEHHTTDESINSTILFLDSVENCDPDARDRWHNLDEAGFAAMVALQMRYLRGDND